LARRSQIREWPIICRKQNLLHLGKLIRIDQEIDIARSPPAGIAVELGGQRHALEHQDANSGCCEEPAQADDFRDLGEAAPRTVDAQAVQPIDDFGRHLGRRLGQIASAQAGEHKGRYPMPPRPTDNKSPVLDPGRPAAQLPDIIRALR